MSVRNTTAGSCVVVLNNGERASVLHVLRELADAHAAIEREERNAGRLADASLSAAALAETRAAIRSLEIDALYPAGLTPDALVDAMPELVKYGRWGLVQGAASLLGRLAAK